MTDTFIHPFPTATGFEFRPAYTPADYIGPRLDCLVPLRADDSPLPAKGWDDMLLTWDGTLGGSIGDITVNPAQVPLGGSGALMVLTILAAVGMKYAGRFGDWFSRERGGQEGKNGWV